MTPESALRRSEPEADAAEAIGAALARVGGPRRAGGAAMDAPSLGAVSKGLSRIAALPQGSAEANARAGGDGQETDAVDRLRYERAHAVWMTTGAVTLAFALMTVAALGGARLAAPPASDATAIDRPVEATSRTR